ncbi:3-hydroxyacyl-CoA dehydrogenase NAD-binding domain-containing protein [Sagittula stellata]|uniref:enoyl-CoA hydratase n=1 Tax=Sagittula stellata (strain ATCC 700073 / DSM 11524 / E-37) TaxID=388399 RepID=A3K506_SAGS3|nr:3-hydroxyacyl-CoA dehydrogenase NAD-binding domain-containing protein [Sagittula stellata]EBA07607.1 putative fatty acid oxidation complex alpha subunit [Sagittula stellata E-37]
MTLFNEIDPDDAPGATRPPETENWRRAETDGLLTLWLDCPGTSTNTISETVLRELDVLLDDAKQAQPRGVALRSAKRGGFAAGADIDGFADLRGQGATEMLQQGHDVLDKLAALPVPTIAVIHGATLGGGLELALACDYRIGVEGVKVGFPEIQLGLHPGLGGTVRLTQLIDPVEAMQMMLTGRSAHDRKARRLGILDALVPERHVEAAMDAAANGKLSHDGGGLRASALRTRAARSLAANRMRAEAEKTAPNAHFPAPFALIELWERHGGDPSAMQQAEVRSFCDLLDSATAQNLIRVFFLRRRLKSGATGPDGIDHVHVIGAGAMGAEIAAWAAIQGRRVTIEDVALAPLGETVRRATEICGKRHLGGIETRDALDRLMPDPDRLGRARADLIIEAAPEKMEVKEKIYGELADQMKPGAILATNTSSLPLSSLVTAAPVPGHFAGLHFFNPVSKMPLVEVVSHDLASADTLDRLARFANGIDRLPARVKDYPGFLVNRVLAPYMMEALAMLDEGHDKEALDRAALAFGMPMGPVTLADSVGLDICLEVALSLREGLDVPVAETPGWLQDMVDKGHTGRKAGRGLYDYETEKPPKVPADDPDQNVIDRLILPMCNAAVECLRKGIAEDADTVDGALIFGTGWAPFRGGPLHYARVRRDVPDVLTKLAAQHGPRFAPDPGWDDFG